MTGSKTKTVGSNADEEPPLMYRMSQHEVSTILDNHKYTRMRDAINFEDISQSSQFFWYSPVPNLQEKKDQLNVLKQQSQLL